MNTVVGEFDAKFDTNLDLGKGEELNEIFAIDVVIPTESLEEVVLSDKDVGEIDTAEVLLCEGDSRLLILK